MADTAENSASTSSGRYHMDTELVFIEGDAVKDNYNAASVPIYQTATFKQTNADGSGG
ncbi:cystathionine beta-lyase, partial [Coemansia sp. RSA 1285]